MRKLKLFFACLLMAVLSIGQMWATPSTYTWTLASGDLGSSGSPSSSVTKGSPSTTWATSYTWGGSGATKYLGWDGNSSAKGVQIGTGNATNKCASLVLSTSGISGTISAVSINTSGASSVSATVEVSVGSTTFKYNNQNTASLTSSANSYSFTGSATGEIRITWTNSSAKALYIKSISVTYEAGGASTPTVTVSPTSWDFETVHASDAASKVFSVSGSNLTAGQNLSIAVPDGYSVSPNSITVSAATLNATNVTVSKNTTAVGTYNGNMSISGGGQTSAKTVGLSMTVDADPAPTGTFKLFSGDIVEGDYVIVSTNALSNTVNNNRIASQAVTISDNKIVNPNAAVVWHIAASGDYWTLYNADAEKYAGGTTTKNQGALLASVTDYAKWTITGSSTYEFENLGRATGSSDTGNKWLRYNSGNAENSRWACYGTGIGSAVTLYKLDDGKPAAPTFSPAAGSFLEAQSVTLSAEAGAEIYYTMGENPADPTSGSTHYTGAIAVSSTTTIKAVAIKDDKSSNVASATYTIVTPQSVDEIWDDITASGPNDAYVWGYVSQTNVSGYANNFYISVNGSTEGNQLYAYRMNMNSFSVAVGDKVTLNGDLTIVNEIKEFKYTNNDNCGKVIALEAKGALQSVAVSGTPIKTEYAANEDFDPAGLKVMGTYANGFVGEITEGITWSNDLTGGKVTESTTVHVTATVGGQTSSAYDVAVTVAAKTLVSIAATPASKTIYTGEVLPEPTIMATFSEGDPEDVSTFAVYDTESAFDTETLGEQTITVSYTFGGATETTTYTVTVIDYANDAAHPYTPEQARYITINAVGSTKATKDIYVQGIVSRANAVTGTNKRQRYWISIDGETTSTEFEVYNGKYLAGADFSTSNQLVAGDEVIVKGKVIYYNSTTPEFATGESQLESLARTPNFTITDVTAFEVGAADLAVADLTYLADGEGAVTFASSNHEEFVTIVEGKLHAVAAGTATITANLAQNGIYKAATTTFDVTVTAATVKYAVTFDDNGKTGGSAPEAIADQAEGAEVTLPGNTWTKTGYTFDGWKVINNTTSAEVAYTGNSFTMPASAVTIQAQWAALPVQAYTYTSNVTLSGAKVKFYGESTEYDAVKAGTGSAAGSTSITVPAQATKLHFHAYGWNSESVGLTVTAPTGVTVSPATEISINSNSGIASNSPFTLAEGSTPMTDAYYVVSLSGNDDEIELTFTATSGKRFVLFGVNQEGGVEPELDHIIITGELTNKDYELGDEVDKTGLTVRAYYTLAGVAHHNEDVTSDVVWSNDPLTGGQTSVDVTATYGGKSDTKACAINAVVVPTPEIILSESALEFSGKQYGAVANKTFNVTLKNVAAATVALSGDDAAKFSVDPTALTANGTVTVSVANASVAGNFSATITVSDDASAATAQTVALTLTLTADEAPAWNAEWVEATELYDGMPILITGVNSTTSKTYAVGAQNSNNRAAVEASVDGNGVLTPGTGTKQFTLEVVDAENNQYAIKTSDGKYLYAAGSGSGKNYLRSQATNDDNGVWTLTTTSAEANGTNTNKYMKFNTSGMFSCYSSGQTAIKLYTPKSYTRTVSGNYGTICLPKAGVLTNGTLFEIAYYGQTSKKIFFDEILNNEMVAGRPYLFKPNENVTELKVAYTDSEDPVAAGNHKGLHGFYNLADENATFDIEQDAGYYIMYGNQYWLVSGRDAYIENYRAYIVLSDITTIEPAKAPGTRRVSLNVNGEQTATDIDVLNAEEAPVKMMIDGQLFILRGKKLYDATGRLVK